MVIFSFTIDLNSVPSREFNHIALAGLLTAPVGLGRETSPSKLDLGGESAVSGGVNSCLSELNAPALNFPIACFANW